MPKIETKITADGKHFNKGIDGAKQKVKELDDKVKNFNLSMEGWKKIAGIGIAIAGFKMMFNAIDEVVKLSKDGINLVDKSQLAMMKQTNALIEEMTNKAKGFGAIVSEYMVGGLIAFGYQVKNIVQSVEWKEFLLGGGITKVKVIARAIKGGSEKGNEEAAAALANAKSNEEKKRGVELDKELKKIEEEANQASMSDAEKLAASIEKSTQAKRQYNSEVRNGGKDENFMKEQLIIVNEEFKKQEELVNKIAEAEKKKAKELQDQSTKRQDKIEKWKEGEREIAEIRKEGNLVGATLEQQITANKEKQLELAKAVAREGGEKGQDKAKQLAETVNEEKKLQLDLRKRKKKEADIKAEAKKDVSDLTDPKKFEATSRALGGAAQGMYLGGTDRSGISRQSKAETIAEKTKDILEKMAKDISELNGGGI